jgi:hypothetical protein
MKGGREGRASAGGQEGRTRALRKEGGTSGNKDNKPLNLHNRKEILVDKVATSQNSKDWGASTIFQIIK